MKASIVAIGTELTTGQILNRNASTIAAKLKLYGVETHRHLTVPDEHQLMHEALTIAEKSSDMIIITGGLGPTSDDFTRKVVAEWANLNLKFDEVTWIYIQDRLSKRGYPVREIQKQQCYFPETSEILTNSQGTAHGFYLKKNKIEVFVLPGPPREIEAIWNDHIEPKLKVHAKNLDKQITKAWDTMGLGESEVAYQVEEILKNYSDLKPEVGYRVHLPYVELKLSYLNSQTETYKKLINQIDEKLKPITITKDFVDVLDLVVNKIQKSDFTFYDFATDGFLMTRLSSQLKKLSHFSFKQSTESPNTDWFNDEDNFLALIATDKNQVTVMASLAGKKLYKSIESPFKDEIMAERRRQYFAEMALVEFVRLA